jgi:FtsZ-binding cell division protein ZapB
VIILDRDRTIADLKVELAAYQKYSGTSGSKEKIQVIKLGNEFLRAAKTAPLTVCEATEDLSSSITTLKNITSNPASPPTVSQITFGLSACFLPLFQRLHSSHQALLTTHQDLEATKCELATLKAMNEGLQQQVNQHSYDKSTRPLLTVLQSEIEALKKEISEYQARLTAARQENKKLKSQNSELKEKVGSFRKHIRQSEESYSTSTSGGSIEPPDEPMIDGSTMSPQELPQERDAEIRVLEQEQRLLAQTLEGEKNKRLGVEMELADLKADYEMQERMMLDWFLEMVRITNGDQYLKKLKKLKEIRPTASSTSRGTFHRLLG